VHAKACIVDDTWMTCGSDNFNRRSWTSDSEITCATVAPDLARQLRTQLWSEHLGMPVDDTRLLDHHGSVELWNSSADSRKARVRRHEPAPVRRVQRLWAEPLYRTIFDPDGRPRRLQRSNTM
jgi:phosphatidylserine/phosphatidylglycerophosphate/cardiolipin synthase-like enzyme